VRRRQLVDCLSVGKPQSDLISNRPDELRPAPQNQLYILITTLLGIVVLGERVTTLKIASLGCILVGVVLLAHSPARYGVTPEAASSDTRCSVFGPWESSRPTSSSLGSGPSSRSQPLKGLDATQLNGLMAIAMTAVAGVALTVRGPRLPMTKRTLVDSVSAP
jgi:drug/metabolite transporter (DMT)-like permease